MTHFCLRFDIWLVLASMVESTLPVPLEINKEACGSRQVPFCPSLFSADAGLVDVLLSSARESWISVVFDFWVWTGTTWFILASSSVDTEGVDRGLTICIPGD